jgi:hypothetical protein
MAYPNRTTASVTLPGAASATKVLETPVDGGIDGAAADGSAYLEGFIATEETGVGRVETTS